MISFVLKSKFSSGLLLAAILFTASCKKEDKVTPTPGTPAAKCRMTQSVKGNQTTFHTYTPENKLGETSTTVGNKTTKTMAEYSSGKLSKLNIVENGIVTYYMTFEYGNDGRLSKQHMFAKDSSSHFNEYQYSTYTYNNKGLISEEKEYDPETNQLLASQTREYDSKGNLIKKASYNYANEQPILSYTTEYTYDDKRNPWYNMDQYAINEGNNPNNRLTEVTKDKHGIEESATTYAYTYTSEGYPASITTTSGGKTETSTATYICQ